MIHPDTARNRLVGIGLPANVFDFAYLRAVPKPTLLLHGDRDTWGDTERVRAVAEAAGPNASLQILAGADHFFEAHLDALMTSIPAFARPDP